MPQQPHRIGAGLSDVRRPIRGSLTASDAPVSEDIIRELQGAISSTPPPVEASLTENIFTEQSLHPVDVWSRKQHHTPVPEETVRTGKTLLSLVPWFLGAGLVIGGLLYVSQYGLRMKSRVVQQGNAAIGNLLSAKESIEQMDWTAAHGSFTAAKEQFDDAAGKLNLLGSTVTSVLSKIPGLHALGSGQDLLEAGQYISDAGEAMSEALAALSKSGGILDTSATDRTSLGQVFLPLQEALNTAEENMARAAELIEGVNEEDLSDDMSAQFVEFRARMPQLQSIITQGSEAVSFLSALTGVDHPRRYLLLFQNSSELRPTGGFPGSYGLVTFENGRMRQMATDDIYNPDGQIRELVVPPLQLQHITPSWGMRDANWFIDVPASARKVMEYYRRGGGAAVDGVIIIRPEVVVDILHMTGPISMPAYNIVLDADNFLPTIQLEVESKKTAEPKKIIEDLAPLLIDRLSSAPAQQWLSMVDTFRTHLLERDMMMYFADPHLQEYVVSQGWDGGVRQTDGDYLMVDISNIKGAKTDAVTDTAMKLESSLENGAMVHRLTLTRQHNGLGSSYGFYSKINYSYVRVLVPKGSTLRGISGNDRPNNRPLLDYATEKNVVRDTELTALEATYQYDAVRAATTYEESGKTGFGFWMKVEPGKTQSVQLEYTVPAKYVASDYRLTVQRQPGLDLSDFELTVEKKGGVTVSDAQPSMTAWPDSWRLHDTLRQDLDFSATLDH